jgi:hypothetical protein
MTDYRETDSAQNFFSNWLIRCVELQGRRRSRSGGAETASQQCSPSLPADWLQKIGSAGCDRRGRPGSRDQGYLLAVPGAGWTATVRQPNGKSGVSPDDVTFSTSHAKGRPRRAQERNDRAGQDRRRRVSIAGPEAHHAQERFNRKSPKSSRQRGAIARPI